MEKIKCHICKAKNKKEICKRCGANLSIPITEQLVISSGRFTYLDYNGESFNRNASCKVALTNQRIVIYKIKPEAVNPAFGLIKDLINTIKKYPCISINLDDIEWIRRYNTNHLINTKTESYYVCLNNFKQWDELFTPYKQAEEK